MLFAQSSPKSGAKVGPPEDAVRFRIVAFFAVAQALFRGWHAVPSFLLAESVLPVAGAVVWLVGLRKVWRRETAETTSLGILHAVFGVLPAMNFVRAMQMKDTHVEFGTVVEAALSSARMFASAWALHLIGPSPAPTDPPLDSPADKPPTSHRSP